MSLDNQDHTQLTYYCGRTTLRAHHADNPLRLELMKTG